MNPGKVTSFARTDAPLAAGGVYLSDWIQVGLEQIMKQIPGGGYSMIRGFINADAAGFLDIFQAYNLADIAAITAGAPPVATGDAKTLLKPSTFPSIGITNPGSDYFVAISAPYVRLRYTNGPAPQTFFRLNFDIAE